MIKLLLALGSLIISFDALADTTCKPRTAVDDAQKRDICVCHSDAQNKRDTYCGWEVAKIAVKPQIAFHTMAILSAPATRDGQNHHGRADEQAVASKKVEVSAGAASATAAALAAKTGAGSLRPVAPSR